MAPSPASLPVDVFNAILDFVDERRTLARLQRVCNGFNNLVAPRLRSKVELVYGEDDRRYSPDPKLFPVLDALSALGSRNAPFVKKLSVDCQQAFAPGIDLPKEKRLQDVLEGALANCTNLEKFRYSRVNLWVHRNDAFLRLSSLKHLKSVSIMNYMTGSLIENAPAHIDPVGICLPPIPCGELACLTIHGINGNLSRTVESLAETFLGSPKLQTLDLAADFYRTFQYKGSNRAEFRFGWFGENIFKEICKAYALKTWGDELRKLKLRSLRLGSGIYLTGVPTKSGTRYASEAIDLSFLKEFRYDPSPKDYGGTGRSNWQAISAAAGNLASLSVARITSEMLWWFEDSRILAGKCLRKFEVLEPRDESDLRSLLDVLGAEETGTLRSLHFVASKPFSRDILKAIARKLPLLEELVFNAFALHESEQLDPRDAWVADNPIPGIVEELSALKSLKHVVFGINGSPRVVEEFKLAISNLLGVSDSFQVLELVSFGGELTSGNILLDMEEQGGHYRVQPGVDDGHSSPLVKISTAEYEWRAMEE